MTGRRDQALLRLQHELAAGGGAALETQPPDLLSFQVEAMRFSLPCAEISRLQMPADLIPLWGYAELPACVIGVAGGDGEMLSVVDAGLLFGSGKIARTLKSRLIVFSEGPLKGVALLVDRVGDRLRREEAPADMAHHTAASLHTALWGKAEASREGRA